MAAGLGQLPSAMDTARTHRGRSGDHLRYESVCACVLFLGRERGICFFLSKIITLRCAALLNSKERARLWGSGEPWEERW